MRFQLSCALACLVASFSASAKDVVGLSLTTLNNPFFVTLSDGAKAAAAKAGISLVVMDAQEKADKQAADIEDLIQKKVKVILINPTDATAIASTIRRANAAGIPVVTVDRAASGDGKVAYHIASDNVAGGKLAGDLVCKLAGSAGHVVELEGVPGSSSARDRGTGFNAALKAGCPGVTVVSRQTANYDRGQGLSVMENILQARKTIDVVFAHNDEMALGALQAIKASGRHIKIVGFDATDDALKEVNRCGITATVAQEPAEMGRLAVQKAVQLSHGAKAPAHTEFIPVALKLVTNSKCK